MVFIPGTFPCALPSNSHKTYTYEEERTRHMGEVEQLVRRSKKRNPDAFTELMQLHERDMYRTASAILSQGWWEFLRMHSKRRDSSIPRVEK